MSDMSQTERQIFILMLLSENKRGYNIEEIHSRLQSWGENVDARTIRRDIDSLSGLCFITEEVRSGTTYFSAGKFHLENLTFDSGDLISLTFLTELLQPYEHSSMGKNALTLIRRIIQHTGNLNQEFVNYFHEYVSLKARPAHANEKDHSDYEAVLQHAITEHQKVQMIYLGFGQETPVTRIVHPYEFILRDGNLSVAGYCELRKAIREFRLSRIQKLTLLSDSFQRQPDSESLDAQNRFLHLSGSEKQEIKLIFHPSAADYVREYDASLADRIELREDGSLLFTRSCAITNDLIRWILGYGSGVTVLAPEKLKKEIHESLSAAVNLYS